MNLIIFLSSIISIFYLLYFTYLFQIKEYRFDRIKVMIQELGFFRFFINTTFKLPAKTFRNILISFFSIFLYIFIYRGVSTINSWIVYLFILFLTPLISLFVVSISTVITSIFSYIKRRQIILQAIQKKSISKAVFIGITGSYGKTTTKDLLFELLSTSFQVAKTDKNMNTDVGVSLSVIKNLKPQTQYFIAEMGAYRRGEIKTICDIVKPTYGIMTGIGNQHLALFGSLDNLIKTKSELMISLPKSGKAYVNKDKGFDYFQNQTKCSIVSFGQPDADITIKKLLSNKISIYEIEYKKNRIVFNTPIQNQFLTNLLPAIALSIDLGIPQEKISALLPKLIKDLHNKMTTVIKSGMKIINFSYSANVDGFINAIDLIKSSKRKNNIIISKGIIELGYEKNNSYKKIISQLDNTTAILYTTDSLFYKLKRRENIILFKNEDEIMSAIHLFEPKETSLCIVGRFSKKFKDIIFNNTQ